MMHYRICRLSWHIPGLSDEVWIKLGGDKKGGTFTFKFCFQIVNVTASVSGVLYAPYEFHLRRDYNHTR